MLGGPISRRALLHAATAAVAAHPIVALAERLTAAAGREASLVREISHSAEPLPSPDDPAFGHQFDRFGSAQVVLLGEATHGTSEFYQARTQITRRLIEEHGFTIVA